MRSPASPTPEAEALSQSLGLTVALTVALILGPIPSSNPNQVAYNLLVEYSGGWLHSGYHIELGLGEESHALLGDYVQA